MAWWNCHIKLNDTSVNACNRSQPASQPSSQGKRGFSTKCREWFIQIRFANGLLLAYHTSNSRPQKFIDVSKIIYLWLKTTKLMNCTRLLLLSSFPLSHVLCVPKTYRCCASQSIVPLLLFSSLEGGGWVLLDAWWSVGRESKESSPRTNKQSEGFLIEQQVATDDKKKFGLSTFHYRYAHLRMNYCVPNHSIQLELFSFFSVIDTNDDDAAAALFVLVCAYSLLEHVNFIKWNRDSTH